MEPDKIVQILTLARKAGLDRLDNSVDKAMGNLYTYAKLTSERFTSLSTRKHSILR